MDVTIRELTANDWQTLRDIRLTALKTDPAVFGSNFAAESEKTEQDWKLWLRSDDVAIFGIFDASTPVGMTCVSVSRGDPSKRTALFWGSWLAPEFRRRGISEMMYRSRIDWAKNHPTIERITISHRASNVASKHANQKHGFVFKRRYEKIWPDGIAEDDVCYELDLKKE